MTEDGEVVCERAALLLSCGERRPDSEDCILVNLASPLSQSEQKCISGHGCSRMTSNSTTVLAYLRCSWPLQTCCRGSGECEDYYKWSAVLLHEDVMHDPPRQLFGLSRSRNSWAIGFHRALTFDFISTAGICNDSTGLCWCLSLSRAAVGGLARPVKLTMPTAQRHPVARVSTLSGS